MEEGVTPAYVYLCIRHAQEMVMTAEDEARALKLPAVAHALEKITRDLGGIMNIWDELVTPDPAGQSSEE